MQDTNNGLFGDIDEKIRAVLVRFVLGHSTRYSTEMYTLLLQEEAFLFVDGSVSREKGAKFCSAFDLLENALTLSLHDWASSLSLLSLYDSKAARNTVSETNEGTVNCKR